MIVHRLLVCAVVLLSGSPLFAQPLQVTPGVPIGSDILPGTEWPLITAGYDLTEGSLIAALSDPATSVVGSACVFLARRAQSSQAVEALMAVLRNGDDGPASLAAGALHQLSTRSWEHRELARQWEGAALTRLPAMIVIPAQLYVADLLAGIGRADGWQFVREAVIRGYRTDAQHLLLFQGLRDGTGRPIDVETELDEILQDERAARVKDRIAATLREVREIVKGQREGTLPLDRRELSFELLRRRQDGTVPR